MFPGSVSAKRPAAVAESLNTYDVVAYMGTALASVAESGDSCPACN